jgi:hypothetical protein
LHAIINPFKQIKTKIDNDPRYKNPALHSADKEELFHEYADNLEDKKRKQEKYDR